MIKNKFYFLAASFAFGVLFRSFFSIPLAIILLIGMLALSIFLYGICILREKPKKIILISLAIFSFSLGLLRMGVGKIHNENKIFAQTAGQKVLIEGVITEERGRGVRDSKFILNAEKIYQEDRAVKINENILLTADPYQDLHYGDKISVFGKIDKPKNIKQENGRGFDYISYLAKDGIYYEAKYPSITVTAKDHGNAIIKKLLSFKNNFLHKINQEIPAPENILLSGILLGQKQDLNQDLKKDFIATGTIHIVALSGYNITIVAETIMKFFSFLPRFFAQYIGAISIILFAIMTGGGATVVRASLMALLVIIARGSGRTYDAGRALIIAGALMLVQNPWILVFDSSFQLSFLATVGIIFLEPKIKRNIAWIPEKFGIRDIVSGTLAAEILVLPMLIYQTGMFSLISLPANLLVLPLIPATMLFGFLSSAGAFISHIIAIPFDFVSYGLLHYELWIINSLASLPLSSVAIKNFPIILLLGIYAVIAWFIFKPEKSADKKIR